MREIITYHSEHSINEFREILTNHFNEKPHWLFSQKTWSGKIINENEFIIKSKVDIDLENYFDPKPYITGKLKQEDDSNTIVTMTIRHTYLLSTFTVLPILISGILWILCMTNEKYYEYVVIPKIATISFSIFQIILIFILRFNLLHYYEKLINLKKV